MIKVNIVCVLVALSLLPTDVVYAESVLTRPVIVDPGRVALARKQSFTLLYGQQKWEVTAAEISKWFKTKGSNEDMTMQLRPNAIYDYLNIYISPKFNDLGQASRFVRVGADIVMTGSGRKGRIIDGVKTSLAIRNAIVAGKNTASIIAQDYRPAIFSVDDFKKLVFPNLLTRVETNFAGSPANRILNITVGTSHMNGLVIMPNEEFSFNRYLGPVDKENGYAPELVIKENVTTPEYGGGICQISTTAFRAALYGGLKITQRRNHSYPVVYYGKPGADATVYAPRTDLKFINDTGNPIQMLARAEGKKVIFELWGTSDGRRITVNGPFITEKRPNGSIKAAIAQIVTKGTKVIREQNFESTYQSPDKFPTIKKANRG